MGGREECSGVLPCLNCIHCRSDLKKSIEIFHGSCSVLCSFTDVAAGDGYPASWLGSRADPQGGRVGTSWLFPSFASCQLKVQMSARCLCRCENTDLHVCAMSLRDPLTCSALQLRRGRSAHMMVTSRGCLVADVARGRAFPAFPAPRLDPGLDPSRHPKGE